MVTTESPLYCSHINLKTEEKAFIHRDEKTSPTLKKHLKVVYIKKAPKSRMYQQYCDSKKLALTLLTDHNT